MLVFHLDKLRQKNFSWLSLTIDFYIELEKHDVIIVVQLFLHITST